MRKPSREELERRLTEADKQNGLLYQALTDGMVREPGVHWLDFKEDEKVPGYRYGVSRLSGPCGGILWTRFAPGGQKPSLTVEYLDDAAQQIRDAGIAVLGSPEARMRAIAVERARMMRSKEWEVR